MHEMSFKCLKYLETVSLDPFPLRALHQPLHPPMNPWAPPRLWFQTFNSSPSVSQRTPWYLAPHLGVRMCLAAPCQFRTARFRKLRGGPPHLQPLRADLEPRLSLYQQENYLAPSRLTRLIHYMAFNRVKDFPLKKMCLWYPRM